MRLEGIKEEFRLSRRVGEKRTLLKNNLFKSTTMTYNTVKLDLKQINNKKTSESNGIEYGH